MWQQILHGHSSARGQRGNDSIALEKTHQTEIAMAAENLNHVETLDRALFAINALDLEPGVEAHIVIRAGAAHLQWRCSRSTIAWSCVDSVIVISDAIRGISQRMHVRSLKKGRAFYVIVPSLLERKGPRHDCAVFKSYGKNLT